MNGQRWFVQVLSLFLGMIGMLLVIAGGMNLAYINQERETQLEQQQAESIAPATFVAEPPAAAVERQGFHPSTLDGRSSPGTRALTPASGAPQLGVRATVKTPADAVSVNTRNPGTHLQLPATKRISNGAPVLLNESERAVNAAAAPVPVQADMTSGNGLRLPSEVPTRIVIPAIKLDASIVPVPMTYKDSDPAGQYIVPDYRVVGWHADSARLGDVGNVVMNGHHNVFGMVFGHLKDLQAGDTIIVYGNQRVITYTLTERHLLQERGVSMDVRLEHARYLQPTKDQILTLITCWPPTDFSHRLILVARPVADLPGGRTTAKSQ